ncbi:hypothetical protein P4O66_015316 [Electrophorus voltai]|uniref:Uncharacterized protein n=1 Tax=Electrophorus voltai TaxID=2609070 RepID=A0AAD8YXZ2_9TELE|nr:hypothetical protein P4O66_015316 [Electrophorus voltai]
MQREGFGPSCSVLFGSVTLTPHNEGCRITSCGGVGLYQDFALHTQGWEAPGIALTYGNSSPWRRTVPFQSPAQERTPPPDAREDVAQSDLFPGARENTILSEPVPVPGARDTTHPEPVPVPRVRDIAGPDPSPVSGARDIARTEPVPVPSTRDAIHPEPVPSLAVASWPILTTQEVSQSVLVGAPLDFPAAPLTTVATSPGPTAPLSSAALSSGLAYPPLPNALAAPLHLPAMLLTAAAAPLDLPE